MKKDLVAILNDFPKIDLDQLNSSARFMERIETKYLLDSEQLKLFFKKALKHYYILQINDRLVFSYHNVYMDTQDYLFYHEHAALKDKRVKLRTRQYVNSKQTYFEFKQREGKLIRKFRYECDGNDHGKMTDEAHKFYAKLITEFNSKHNKQLVSPSMATNYKRITLCSKNSDERVTIDFDLELKDLRNPKARGKNLNHFAIIESKSSGKDCLSGKIMKELEVKRAKNCSKYCLAVYYFKRSATRKTFEKTIKHIEKMKKKQIPTVKKATQKLIPVAA